MHKRVICACLTLLSCGTATEGKNGSDGDDTGSGGVNGGLISSCSGRSLDAPACVIQPPDFVRAGYEPIQDLTVVGVVPAEPADCGVLVPAGEDTRALLASIDTTAWALQNDSGDRWVVVANASFFPESALLSGDTVSLEYGSSYGEGGTIVVSSGDGPLLAVLESYAPNFLRLSREEEECKVDPCWTRSAVRIATGSGSVVLGTDEQAATTEFTFLNDYYQPRDPCQATADQDFFNIAMYRTVN